MYLRQAPCGAGRPSFDMTGRPRLPLRFRRLLAGVACLLVAFSVVAVRSVPRSGGSTPASAKVDPNSAQTIVGFGASGAWWPQDLVRFSSSAQQHVASLLFSPTSGIGLSIYRYNVGAGGRVKVPSRYTQTFLAKPGQYDWSRDQGGVTFLRFAQQAGVPTLVAFANSAPWLWKTNNAGCGGALKPGHSIDYAGYLADVVQHLHDAEGISLNFVSPMNEPDESFTECYQEGMFVPIWQRVPIMDAVSDALAQKAPYARVIGDESGHLASQFLKAVPKWLNTDTAARLGALVHHGYDYPNWITLQKAAAVAAQYKVPLWMSEVCCYDGHGFGPGYDPTMGSGMWLARTIFKDLTFARDAAFTWWTALSPALGCAPASSSSCAHSPNPRGWDDGLLYYDSSYASSRNQRIYPTKRFWVLGNFSRYVRPGAVVHAVSGLPKWMQAIAFRDGDGAWSVVVINSGRPGSWSTTARIRLPSGAMSSVQSVHAYETSAGRDLQEVGAPMLDRSRDSFTVATPPQSVTTITLGSR